MFVWMCEFVKGGWARGSASPQLCFWEAMLSSMKFIPSTGIFANNARSYYQCKQPHGKCLCSAKKAFRCKWTFILFVTHSALANCTFSRSGVRSLFDPMRCHRNRITTLYFISFCYSLVNFTRCEPFGTLEEHIAKSHSVLTDHSVMHFILAFVCLNIDIGL